MFCEQAKSKEQTISIECKVNHYYHPDCLIHYLDDMAKKFKRIDQVKCKICDNRIDEKFLKMNYPKHLEKLKNNIDENLVSSFNAIDNDLGDQALSFISDRQNSCKHLCSSARLEEKYKTILQEISQEILKIKCINENCPFLIDFEIIFDVLGKVIKEEKEKNNRKVDIENKKVKENNNLIEVKKEEINNGEVNKIEDKNAEEQKMNNIEDQKYIEELKLIPEKDKQIDVLKKILLSKKSIVKDDFNIDQFLTSNLLFQRIVNEVQVNKDIINDVCLQYLNSLKNQNIEAKEVKLPNPPEKEVKDQKEIAKDIQ